MAIMSALPNTCKHFRDIYVYLHVYQHIVSLYELVRDEGMFSWKSHVKINGNNSESNKCEKLVLPHQSQKLWSSEVPWGKTYLYKPFV